MSCKIYAGLFLKFDCGLVGEWNARNDHFSKECVKENFPNLFVHDMNL